ncbi:MAG: hypothetical protein AAFQ20_03075 [Bacteroidota bacterium]
MKFNLVFLLNLILALFMVSCSAEDGELGTQDEDNLYAYETGDHERTDEPSTD